MEPVGAVCGVQGVVGNAPSATVQLAPSASRAFSTTPAGSTGVRCGARPAPRARKRGRAPRRRPRPVTSCRSLGPDQARDARRGPRRAWAHDERRRSVLHFLAAARSLHGEHATGLRAGRQHFDELGLDAVEAAVGAVQHLLQVRRVEPYGTERPPRQCDGHRRTGQRFLYCLFPGLDRLQQSAPQRLADQARQHAGLQRRQHPVDVRSGRDELPHGRESRRVGSASDRAGTASAPAISSAAADQAPASWSSSSACDSVTTRARPQAARSGKPHRRRCSSVVTT